jgi:hypothetical protein
MWWPMGMFSEENELFWLFTSGTTGRIDLETAADGGSLNNIVTQGGTQNDW